MTYPDGVTPGEGFREVDKCPKCGSMHTKDTRRVKLMHPPIPIWSCLSCGFEWDRHDLIRSDDG